MVIRELLIVVSLKHELTFFSNHSTSSLNFPNIVGEKHRAKESQQWCTSFFFQQTL
jgi:hypothetical protein